MLVCSHHNSDPIALARLLIPFPWPYQSAYCGLSSLSFSRRAHNVQRRQSPPAYSPTTARLQTHIIVRAEASLIVRYHWSRLDARFFTVTVAWCKPNLSKAWVNVSCPASITTPCSIRQPHSSSMSTTLYVIFSDREIHDGRWAICYITRSTYHSHLGTTVSLSCFVSFVYSFVEGRCL